MESFTEITALAALSVTAFQQILKLNVVPLFFANKYPILTNIVLSVFASVFVTWQTALQLAGITQWVAYAGLVSVLSAITYNMTIKNSDGVQRLSNKVK